MRPGAEPWFQFQMHALLKLVQLLKFWSGRSLSLLFKQGIMTLWIPMKYSPHISSVYCYVFLLRKDEMQCYSKHNQNFRPNLTGVGQCVFCQRLRPSRTPPSNVSHRCIFVQNDTLLEIDSGGPTILLLLLLLLYYQRLLKYCWMLSLIVSVISLYYHRVQGSSHRLRTPGGSLYLYLFQHSFQTINLFGWEEQYITRL